MSVPVAPPSLSEVGQAEQERALAAALSDSLWLAGQELSATVTLVAENYCITPHLDYKLDNFTEKVATQASPSGRRHLTCVPFSLFQLQLFTFNRNEDVRKFILEHVQCVSEGICSDGCLCCSSPVSKRSASRQFTEEGGHGVILFLYSLLCSRTVDR